MYMVTSNGQFLSTFNGQSWETDVRKASFFPDDTLEQLKSMLDSSLEFKLEIRTLDGGLVYQNYTDENIILS